MSAAYEKSMDQLETAQRGLCMEYINTDTSTLVTAAILGCSVERLREAYAGLEKRERTMFQIRSLIRMYKRYGLETAECQFHP
jgi:hypothetical protein